MAYGFNEDKSKADLKWKLFNNGGTQGKAKITFPYELKFDELLIVIRNNNSVTSIHLPKEYFNENSLAVFNIGTYPVYHGVEVISSMTNCYGEVSYAENNSYVYLFNVTKASISSSGVIKGTEDATATSKTYIYYR